MEVILLYELKSKKIISELKISEHEIQDFLKAKLEDSLDDYLDEQGLVAYEELLEFKQDHEELNKLQEIENSNLIYIVERAEKYYYDKDMDRLKKDMSELFRTTIEQRNKLIRNYTMHNKTEAIREAYDEVITKSSKYLNVLERLKDLIEELD